MKKSTFCVLPFFGVELNNSGKNIHCCRLTHGTDIEHVRNAMKSNKRPAECRICWELEDQGLESERLIHNKSFDFYADRNIEDIEAAAYSGDFSPQIVKIPTSNLCNGTCVTCDPGASSAWAALKNKKIPYQKISSEYLDTIKWGEIIQLSFVGGEPLLEKKNFEILSELIKSNNTKCFISFVTNGSIAMSKEQLEILSKFSNLNICVSIDGVGKSFEYMRYPLKWDDLTKNLLLFKQIAKYVSVSCMISNLNIFYYTDMIEFFKKEKINYLCKQIDNPKYFAPGNLPDTVKQKILDNNPQYQFEVKSFLTLGAYTEELFLEAKNEIKNQDLLKNININDYLPELNLE